MYSDKNEEIIAQGAEAVVKKVEFLGKVCILKRRLVKSFRHKTLDDQLTKGRMVAECRSTAKLRKHGVYVPVIYLVDFTLRETIYEFIPGDTVKTLMDKGQFKSFDLMGENVSKMHNANIIHGDLTTKNMMMTVNKTFCIIDFGLSFFSTIAEDKAVDLYVLERCLTAEQKFLKAYRSNCDDSDEVYRKLEEVRLRGRKRDLTG